VRVTNKMIANTVLYNLSANLKRMQKLQDQMSTGNVISKPSDDPVIATRVLTLNSVMSQHDQYYTNMDDAIGWMEAADAALDSLCDALDLAKEKAVYGANDTLSQTDRDAIAEEIEQLTGNIIQIANTSFGGRYIFSGTKTNTTPYDDNGNYYGNSGVDGKLYWEVSQGVTIAINVDGDEVFNPSTVSPITPDGSHTFFNVLHDLQTALRNSDSDSLSGVILSNLDKLKDNVLNVRAAVGAKCQRLEMAQKQSANETTNYEELLSKLNDVDIAVIYTDFKMQETVYRSALNAGANIMQYSLLDFLK